jgi:gamma-glutamylcyclotransferase (GGCT)/AIG2-like uncharacterized protein YtfP
MDDLSLSEVRRLVAAANAVRWRRDASGSAVGSDRRRAERQLDDLFRTSHTLAVYGTLAPGQPNHHVVAPLGGEWTDGLIEGDLLPMGWGAALGYPGFRPRVGGDAVAVQVLTAPLLATAWPTLDRFEGPGYQRILVPVFSTELGLGQAGERQSPTSMPRPSLSVATAMLRRIREQAPCSPDFG